ncbi:hypothetical protein CHS0354_031662 [Potamilus streckersoni]|uniref:Uncharacterized protein n=1 Tax=Potamilus streckersoni TaxID=2493646 RepID=A0AAE0WD92_9BIVA|nr:hypothetical protein CHS0354_031662 [Potamilus streckersoni]
MDTESMFQARQTTVSMTDTFSLERLSDHTFQENIMYPLQMVCRQLSNIVDELVHWEKQNHSLNEECKNTDRRCTSHYIRCHNLCEPRSGGSDSLKLHVKLAEETEPKLPNTNPSSTDAQLQSLNGSADQTECKRPHFHHLSLRENSPPLARGMDERNEVRFPPCDQSPRDGTGSEVQNESISQIQKTEEEKSGLDDRYCLSKAIQKNLTLLIDVLPYRESELPDFLGEVCLTDNENNRIRGNEQREDQIRLLLRTIMGRSFWDMKHFLDYAGKFNPEEVNKVWKTYDDLKREGNVEKRCIICLVMAYVDIKYVADIMYEKDLIPDSFYGRASECRWPFGCQNKLWKELCCLFQHCIRKDDLVETLINALENKSKYRYLGKVLRRCDRQVFASLKCRCEINRQIPKKFSECRKQTKPVLSIRMNPCCSSSGTTSSSTWSSYSNISLGWNHKTKIRRSSCLRREEFARFYKRRRSFHQSKRQKENKETSTKSFCNSSNEMSERYTPLSCPETSIISILPNLREEMVKDDIPNTQITSKRTSFQDCETTSLYNNSRICDGQSLKNGGQAVFPHDLQKMLPTFLEDVMYSSDQQKDMSDGGCSSMTPAVKASGQRESNKTMLASTVDAITFGNIPTSNRWEYKHYQASEVFCSANQFGERTEFEIKRHMETKEDDVSNDTNKETCTVPYDSESDLFDTERKTIAKTENESGEMLVTPAEQRRLQSKRPSLIRRLAIDSIVSNMKNDSANTE